MPEDFNDCSINDFENGHETIIKYLLELGVDVNHVEPDGDTPLSAACENGHETIIKYLVDHGADVNGYEKGNEEIIK
ncbi:hypothetical protein PIROE2DRAFT_2613 [Piromyces sp. E2]|nr:hypothetical protein PIROE2DRAFT_2613 [Piromyces sp. E2]|eukprot:OUM69516.1 hypothetical protein PIROE2DRAFT_2613 [Piromyces sp. E2]